MKNSVKLNKRRRKNKDSYDEEVFCDEENEDIYGQRKEDGIEKNGKKTNKKSVRQKNQPINTYSHGHVWSLIENILEIIMLIRLLCKERR